MGILTPTMQGGGEDEMPEYTSCVQPDGCTGHSTTGGSSCDSFEYCRKDIEGSWRCGNI